MTTALTRVTVIGERRHLDLRLPSDEPLASLVPQIRALLDVDSEAPRERSTASVLTNALGMVIEDTQTLRSAAIPDGARLFLRKENAIPPAPDVYDISSFTAESTERSPWLWSGHLRSLGLATVAGLILAGSGSAAVLLSTPPGRLPLGIVLATVLLLAGTLLGQFRSVPAGLSVVSAGWLVGVAAALTAGGLLPGAILVCGTVLALAAAAVGTRQYVPFFAAAGLLAGLGLAWGGLFLTTRDSALAAGIAGIVGVFSLGVSPRLATIAAGLSGLDDDQRQGARPNRTRALDSFHLAHRTLAGWTLISAFTAATAAVVVCLSWDRAVWSLLLASALLGSVVFRGLSLPLFGQRAGVYAAAAAGLVGAAVIVSIQLRQPAFVLVTGAVGVLVLAAAQGSVRAQTAARLRVLAARTEMICVLATIPLALGLSGAYTQLGQTFG